MKRVWNTLYKRFECPQCLQEWHIGEKHTCLNNGVETREDFEYWDKLSTKEKNEWRRKFNNAIDYDNYSDVSDYAYKKK